MARGAAPAAAVTAACAAAVCVWLLAFQAGTAGGGGASVAAVVAADRRAGAGGGGGGSSGLLRRGDAAAADVVTDTAPPESPSPSPSASASPHAAVATSPSLLPPSASAPPPPPSPATTPSSSPLPPPATPTGTQSPPPTSPPSPPPTRTPTPSPSPRAASTTAALAACMRRLGAPGGLPGGFGADGRWAPANATCAALWWDARRPAAVAAALANRTLYFLGDSVLRDLMVSLGALLASGPPAGAVDQPPAANASAAAWGAAARLRAKAGCQKTNNADREGACGASYGGGAVGRFMWHQWLAAPHRIPWGSAPGRGTGYQQQEKDGCCAWAHGHDGTNATAAAAAEARQLPSVSPRAPGADDPASAACLAAFLRVRTGMNYPLYDPALRYETDALPDWRAALAEDAHRFLTRALPAAFPGTVVWWLLDPVLDVGEGGRCGEGRLAGLSQRVPEARALQHAAVAAAAAADPAGLAATRLWTVDPGNLFPAAAGAARARLFTDCVHHNFDTDQLKAAALLNVVVAAAGERAAAAAAAAVAA